MAIRTLKSHPILGLVNSYLVDSAQPSSLSYLWNFGSLLAMCLVIQIVTGILLAMHYTPHVDIAFVSVEHIMRDVNYGWLIRYTHANTASLFFAIVYAHVARGLFYGSYRSPRVLPWSIGVVILIVMILTAFLGFESSPKWQISPDLFTIVSFPPLVLSPISPLSSVKLDEYTNKKGFKPLHSWVNLHLQEVRSQIRQTTLHFAGIYLIVNLATGNRYVGSAGAGELPNRFGKHLLNGKGNKNLVEDVEKYGIGNFAYLILEEVPDPTPITIANKENVWLACIQPEYNVLQTAYSSKGIKHSEETKEKIKDAWSEERRTATSERQKGNRQSDDGRARISEARKNIGDNLTPKGRAAIGAARTILLRITDIKTNEVLADLATVLEIQELYGISNKALRKAYNGDGNLWGVWKIEKLGLKKDLLGKP